MIGLFLAALSGFVAGLICADYIFARPFDDHVDDALRLMDEDQP